MPLGKFETARQMFNIWRRSASTAKVINTIRDNTDAICIDQLSIILVLVIKNEAYRVPYFLDYYRLLGVQHFIILDNNSEDNLLDKTNAPDISHFVVDQNYAESRYGVAWINYVCRKYCQGKWVLSVDTDEFLVYPKMEERGLTELCDFLDSSGQTKLFTPLIDMYGERAVYDAVLQEGQNPLSLCRYFDGSGYFSEKGGFGDNWIRGGVRMRCFNKDNPARSPAINKIALAKWSGLQFYYNGAHAMLPKRRNKLPCPKCWNKPSPILRTDFMTGALLHFKFVSDLRSKADYAVKHENHYNGSREYQAYAELGEKSLMYEGSVKYEGIRSLIERGLVADYKWL